MLGGMRQRPEGEGGGKGQPAAFPPGELTTRMKWNSGRARMADGEGRQGQGVRCRGLGV
jgi:hypothetical protein